MVKRRKVKLDTEEQATLETFEKGFEKGKLKSVPHVKEEIERFQTIAQASSNKVKRVSLQMTEWYYNKAQIAALREGIPYQTLLASIIHKYLSGQLVAKHDSNNNS